MYNIIGMYVQLKYVLNDEKNARAIYILAIVFCIFLQLRILTKKKYREKILLNTCCSDNRSYLNFEFVHANHRVIYDKRIDNILI